MIRAVISVVGVTVYRDDEVVAHRLFSLSKTAPEGRHISEMWAWVTIDGKKHRVPVEIVDDVIPECFYETRLS